MMMDIFSIIVLCAVFYVTSAQTKRCHTRDAQHCDHYAMIALPILHGFFSEEIFPNYCSYLGTALQCAEKTLQVCSAMEKLTFSVQSEVHNIVCQERREEHRRSARCLTNPNINRNTVARCLTIMDCGGVYKAIQCTKDYLSTIDGCTLADVSFMGDLGLAYLTPIISMLTCNTSLKVNNIATEPKAAYITTVGLRRIDSTADSRSTAEITLSNAYTPQMFRSEEPTESPKDLAFLHNAETKGTEQTSARLTSEVFEPPSYNARTLEDKRSQASPRNRAGREDVDYFYLMAISLSNLYYVIL